MSLLFMFSFILYLCLYLCTRASGGLILIARQASKCLRHCVFFFASDIINRYNVLLCMAVNHNQICYPEPTLGFMKCKIWLALLSSDLSCLLFAAGCLALWQGGRAVLQKTCVTCLQRWTPSSQLWPLSTLSTKSCWAHSYTDERAGGGDSWPLGIWGRC